MSKARDIAGSTISGVFDADSLSISGTEVIDSSRNFTNIAGGFKTVNGDSVVGSGDISAGASTTFDDVGTYIIGRPLNTSAYNTNTTASSLRSVGYPGEYWNGSSWDISGTNTLMSGTWRCMSPAVNAFSRGYLGLWVRIS